MPSNKIYRHYSILIPVLIFILLASCGQHPCAKGDLRYRLIGFSDAETATIVLRRLQKNKQVTPERLMEMLTGLVWRSENTTEQEFINALTTLREQINQVDDELLTLLGQRMKLSDKIGQYKKDNNITILQTNRWNDILERDFKKGEDLGLTKEFIVKYFDAVHMESIHHQNKVMNS